MEEVRCGCPKGYHSRLGPWRTMSFNKTTEWYCQCPATCPAVKMYTHEEADTKMFMHASYIANTCDSSIAIKSPDTDVFVIGIALESSIESSRLYFHTGRGGNVRTIHLHAIKQHLGDSVSNALIGLHCFTSCDSISAFYGKGKTKPFKLVLQNPRFCSAFHLLGESFTVSEEMVTALEAFVCSLYGQQDCNHASQQSPLCTVLYSQLGRKCYAT